MLYSSFTYKVRFVKLECDTVDVRHTIAGTGCVKIFLREQCQVNLAHRSCRDSQTKFTACILKPQPDVVRKASTNDELEFLPAFSAHNRTSFGEYC